MITSIARVEVVAITDVEAGDRVLKHPIEFMPRASLARVYNSPSIVGVQLRLRSAGSAESRRCAVIDMGDVLFITWQLAGCDKRYGNNC